MHSHDTTAIIRLVLYGMVDFIAVMRYLLQSLLVISVLLLQRCVRMYVSVLPKKNVAEWSKRADMMEGRGHVHVTVVTEEPERERERVLCHVFLSRSEDVHKYMLTCLGIYY